MMGKTRRFLRDIVRNRASLLMLLPAVSFFLLFSYLPMSGIVIAFKQFNYTDGLFGSKWIGLKNFRYLLISINDLTIVLRNTVLYNLAFIALNNFLQITCAILLAEMNSKLFKKITQGIMFLPFFISWVVVGAITYNLLNYEYGFVNTIMKSISAPPLDFYRNPGYWVFIVIAVAAWKSLGYGSVVYLAAITSIDQELYEAAEIDGAGVFKKVRYVTLPCLVPTMIILLLLSMGGIFRGDFSMFYQLVGDNPLLKPTTDVIDTFVTRALLRTSEIGMSASVGLLQSVFCFVMVVTVNTLIRKYNKDYSLF